MAQIGYTPIKLYYSTTAAATPLAADLALGELALNANDGKLYYKNSVTNLVTQVAGGGATYTLNGVAYADTTTSLAANGNLTYNGTTLTAANNISVSGMTVGAGSVGNITNSYIGYQTGTTVSGTNNTAYGYRALRFSTSSRSTAVGTEALATSTGSNDSVAIGYRAVYTATGNSGHCGVGSNALLVATGAYNTALGFNAGSQITTGSERPCPDSSSVRQSDRTRKRPFGPRGYKG